MEYSNTKHLLESAWYIR